MPWFSLAFTLCVYLTYFRKNEAVILDHEHHFVPLEPFEKLLLLPWGHIFSEMLLNKMIYREHRTFKASFLHRQVTSVSPLLTTQSLPGPLSFLGQMLQFGGNVTIWRNMPYNKWLLLFYFNFFKSWQFCVYMYINKFSVSPSILLSYSPSLSSKLLSCQKVPPCLFVSTFCGWLKEFN